MSQKIEREISDRQTGFRKNSGTREAIFSLKVTAERYLEVHKEIFACFIDYSKAFDSVKHEQLIEILQKTSSYFKLNNDVPGDNMDSFNLTERPGFNPRHCREPRRMEELHRGDKKGSSRSCAVKRPDKRAAIIQVK
ncbi:RNA-directed DNA polymerase from mobile element jockey-like [Elysia marginata]|uniref:RNA-directed DNA polymerase from mobile element jockey-like n=1 Tax=Elysia marginata TaxID=1093978 RepID=A0AAV4FV53_9GAST|nr:RNA-directed DNA polymerase from mobile element jockey-like [Elysia marginata]